MPNMACVGPRGSTVTSRSKAVCKECTNRQSATLQDGIVLMLEETYGILNGSQHLAGVDEDNHSGVHEQCGIVPIVALLSPLHCIEQVQWHQRKQHHMGV